MKKCMTFILALLVACNLPIAAKSKKEPQPAETEEKIVLPKKYRYDFHLDGIFAFVRGSDFAPGGGISLGLKGEVYGVEAYGMTEIMQKPGGYCVGVAAANNDLKPIIADAVKALRESGVIGVVASKWLGSSINMSALALTEAAAKGDALAAEEDKGEEASSSSEPKESSIGAVGGNAVNLQDDGTQPGQTTADAGATTDTYWGYTYDTTDYGNTYTEPEATYTEQTDGGAAYTEDAGVQDAGDAGYVDGGGTDAAAEGGEAPAGAEGEAA